MRRGPHRPFQLSLILATTLALFGSGCAFSETKKSFEPVVYTAPPETSFGGAPSVLVIGDSLTVGPFGDRLQAFLSKRIPASKLWIYGSCGSSPEHWLPSTQTFISPCGFRVTSPKKNFLTKYNNGKKPQKVATPKLHQILARFKPRIVIVQLGTNWMDQLMKSMDPKGTEYKNIIRSFIREARSRGPVQIVWILPPDASKYRPAVKDAVDRWIKECAREMDFQTVESRALTSRYILGKSGSDGVHLNDFAASEWANASMKRLQRLSPALR